MVGKQLQLNYLATFTASEYQEMEETKMLATGKRSKGNAIVTFMLMTWQWRIKWCQVGRNWGSSRPFPSPTTANGFSFPGRLGNDNFDHLDLRPQLWKQVFHYCNETIEIYMAMKWKPNLRRQNQIHRTWDRGVHKWDRRKDPRSVGRLHVVNAFLLRFAWMTCCRRFHRRNLVPKILENLKMPLR